MSRRAFEEILALSVAERVQLAEDIWDTIAAQPELLTITDAQRRELDRRLAAAEVDPSSAIPWQKVRAKLERPE